MRLEIPAQLMMVYFLVHLRFVGLTFASPLFLATGMPLPFRFLFAALLTVASAGSVSGVVAEASVSLVLFDSAFSIFVIALRELLIGSAMGILSVMPLIALQVAGEQVGVAMGLSMASVIDPLTQRQSSVIEQFYFLVGLWFYFSWNGHLLLIQSVVESLRVIPFAQLSLFPSGDMALGSWLTEIFRLAVRIIIPFYCALLLADIGLGFLARTVPQMNIFVLGLPVKLALGFFVLVAALPLFVDIVYEQMERWVAFAIESASAW